MPDPAGPIGSARRTVHHETFTLDTRGDGEVIDVTDLAEKSIANSGVAEGTVTVFVAHSTCGVTIIECEPGCNADLNAVLEGIAPEAGRWEHNERNADTNGVLKLTLETTGYTWDFVPEAGKTFTDHGTGSCH